MKRGSGFLLGFLVVALLLAGVVSSFASGSPDGLEKVGIDTGFGDTARDHDLAGSPFADYAFTGVESEFLATAISGVVGVLVTALVGVALFLLIRRRSSAQRE